MGLSRNTQLHNFIEMVTYYVYLIQDQRRLCITTSSISNDNYLELMNIEGNNFQRGQLEMLCKQFCLGYIFGNRGTEVVNDIEEFK